MNSPTTVSPPSRVVPNQWRAFGGIWRLTIRRFLTPGHWLALAAGLAILALLLFSIVGHRNGMNRYFVWMGDFYLTFLVPTIAFISGAGAVRDDLKPGTVDYVFTRPVRRPAFVTFRYLAHMACAQADYLVVFAALVGVGVIQQVPGLFDAVPILLLAQVIVVMAFSAFGFLCGILTSRYIILGLLYAGIVEVGIGQIPTQLNRLSMTHQVKAMLQPLLAPHFPKALAMMQSQGALTTVGWLLLFAALMVAIAATLFSRMEMAGTRSGEA